MWELRILFSLCLLTWKQTHAITWGVSTSAYQTEGGATEGGRSWSIWDEFSHIDGGIRIDDRSNGDITCYSYSLENMERDVQALYQLGIQHYRLSLSWSRLFPHTPSFQINPEGLMYYTHVFDLLHQYNITPWVTLFHWDTPLTLKDEWASPNMIPLFVEYALTCIKLFPSVHHWITFNEPRTFMEQGYERGYQAPGYTNRTLSFVVAHHLLQAHYVAYQHAKYQRPNVSIGMALNIDDFQGVTIEQENMAKDKIAEQAWFSDILLWNTVPTWITTQFPWFDWPFQNATSSLDFYALNYYSSYQIHEGGWTSPFPASPPTASSWLHPYPPGLDHLAHVLEERYHDIKPSFEIVVTENGVSTFQNDWNDGELRGRHFQEIQHVVDSYVSTSWTLDKVFMWSYIDNFEWSTGFTQRFGFLWVDFSHASRPRCMKQSVDWIFPHLLQYNITPIYPRCPLLSVT